MNVGAIICCEINFDYANSPLCWAHNHANFVIWKSQPVDLCRPVVTDLFIPCCVTYRNVFVTLPHLVLTVTQDSRF